MRANAEGRSPWDSHDLQKATRTFAIGYAYYALLESLETFKRSRQKRTTKSLAIHGSQSLGQEEVPGSSRTPTVVHAAAYTEEKAFRQHSERHPAAQRRNG